MNFSWAFHESLNANELGVVTLNWYFTIDDVFTCIQILSAINQSIVLVGIVSNCVVLFVIVKVRITILLYNFAILAFSKAPLISPKFCLH